MNPQPISERPWPRKFGDAFRGMKAGIRGQSSFFVHFFMAAAVIVAALVLRVALIEWCILLLCITLCSRPRCSTAPWNRWPRPLPAKPIRTWAIRWISAAAAVLMASIGAAIVGSIIFINRLGMMLAVVVTLLASSPEWIIIVMRRKNAQHTHHGRTYSRE